MRQLRWGFLSTANIGRKNWVAIRHTENNTLTAVASREVSRSRKFITDCQAAAPFEKPPAAVGSYAALIASPEVDAIYIPLPTALRKEWVIRAAEAGKHVLCEKPCAGSAHDLEEMLEACRRNGVQFMDGVKFMHHPRLDLVRAHLDHGSSVGQIRRIMSVFSFGAESAFFQNNIRVQSELEPAGALGDLGWYCIRFALWALNWEMPVEATGLILSASQGKGDPVPVEFSGELFFQGGGSCGFYCSFLTPDQQWVTVSGTKGWLRLDDFVLPSHPHEVQFELNGAPIRVKACQCAGPHDDSLAVSQQANMFRNFTSQVQSGKLNEEWPDWARKTQQVMDTCFASARQR